MDPSKKNKEKERKSLFLSKATEVKREDFKKKKYKSLIV